MLLQWGFVFIYPALMNMNLHLDLEVDVLLWTLHMQLSHPSLFLLPSPSLREVGDRLSSTKLRLSKFLESFGLCVCGGGSRFSERDPATPGPRPVDVNSGNGD